MITSLLLVVVAQPHLIVGADVTLYRPAADSALTGGATPYADIFGASRGPLVGGHLGLALPLFTDVTLGLAVGVSHFGDSAYAFVDDGGAGTPARADRRSGGTTCIGVTPLSLMASVRLTTLWSRLGVPLIPYGEAGGVAAPWSVARGDGESVASGMTSGLRVGGGLMIELMGIEQRAARQLTHETGVSSVLLTAGATRLWLDGFGAADALPLSDTAWSFALELGF